MYDIGTFWVWLSQFNTGHIILFLLFRQLWGFHAGAAADVVSRFHDAFHFEFNLREFLSKLVPTFSRKQLTIVASVF